MRVGVLQICSVQDYRQNLEKIKKFLKEAKDLKAEAVFLPECFYSLGDGSAITPYLVEGENEHYLNIKNLATEFSLYILGGSASTKVGDKIYNRNFNFDPMGNLIGTYDKIHLFACEIGAKKVDEGKLYQKGSEEKLIQVKDLKIGLSICFDLRYPQMYQNYAKSGANLMTISSAFTVPTGKAHWHTLVRARAIENQCFVVASAQWGVHNEKVITYGHSLVVDPWGEILMDLGDGEKVQVVDLNLEKIIEVKKRIYM
jgi:deaminated glutathione amidase